MSLPTPGSGSVDEAPACRDLGAIVQAWRSTQPVSAKVPEIVLAQARAFVDRAGPLAPPRNLGEAIDEVRRRAPGWGPADFVYWSMWTKGACEWARHDPGWIVHLVDAVFNALPNGCRGPAVFHAWKTGKYPQALLSAARWRELFGVGFIDDNTVRQRPTGTVTLYRGASYGCRRNWSWTSRWATAEIYRLWRGKDILDARQADPSVQVDRSAVWIARVPWSSVLARSRPANPLDDEWVVDTEHAKIKIFDDSPRGNHLPHCRTPRRARATPLGGPVRLGGRPMPGRCLDCGAYIVAH